MKKMFGHFISLFHFNTLYSISQIIKYREETILLTGLIMYYLGDRVYQSFLRETGIGGVILRNRAVYNVINFNYITPFVVK